MEANNLERQIWDLGSSRALCWLLAEPITAFLPSMMQRTKPHLRTTAAFPGPLPSWMEQGKIPKRQEAFGKGHEYNWGFTGQHSRLDVGAFSGVLPS